MKKIFAAAAVAFLAAGTCAFAANPFADVTPDDWAYQAVSDLSDQGVVEGYPDGTFKGERNMTRYELAQIIARLMAKEDQLNAEQRATLDKLAGEYSDDLANLGVRVGNLEKKVGNISWSGDARMRYQNSTKGPSSWNGRMRLVVKGQVNDSTYVQGRLTSDLDFKTNTTQGRTDFDTKTYMQQIFVNHDFGRDVNLRLGRQPVFFGNQWGWFFGDVSGFDGAQVQYSHDKLYLAAGYGQFNTMKKDFADVGVNGDDNRADMFFARGSYDFDFAKLGVDYIAWQDRHELGGNGVKNGNAALDGTKPEVMGVNLRIPVDKFSLQGEYWKNTTAKNGDDTAWNAGLDYGLADWNKPGTWNLGIWYNDIDQGMYMGGRSAQTDMIDNLYGREVNGKLYPGARNLTFWNAMGDLTLQKNVQLHFEYAFGADAEGADDPDDSWTVSLNYQF